MKSATSTGLRNFGAATLALAFLAGCSTHSQPKPDEAKVRQFTGQGYLTDDQFGVATSFATWTAGERRFDIALTVPAKPGPFPLVIYLPALGETRSAGEEWRTAWAQGGYAVLSVQALAEDAKPWPVATGARAGDFAMLARERYAVKVMTARLEAVAAVMTELSRRHSAQESPLERIDLSKVAVAGFDLGAYTAMAVAGENIRGVSPPILPVPITAVIALSPYADFSGAAFDTRYGGVHVPVLSITSDNDADMLGVVTSPAVRKAPFQYMPAGGKYLLTMADIPHSTLGGSDVKPGAGEEARVPEQGGPGGADPRAGGRRGGNRRGSGDRAGPGAWGGEGGSSHFGGARSSPTAKAIGVAAIQSITAAFLDAYVKKDSIAREWLDKDVPRWLGDKGEIRKK